jgi:hypothetical protein
VADRGNDAVDIVHHVAIGEAQHMIALGFEQTSAPGVVLFAGRMVIAIGFDDQLRAVRAEVGIVVAERDLAPEAIVRKSLA